MRQTPKQLLAQKVLAQHKVVRAGKVTLMYTLLDQLAVQVKKPVIIVSVPKKIVPKATARNYIKRVLRATLQQNISKPMLATYVWMWICKEPKIAKEMRLHLADLLSKLTT